MKRADKRPRDAADESLLREAFLQLMTAESQDLSRDLSAAEKELRPSAELDARVYASLCAYRESPPRPAATTHLRKTLATASVLVILFAALLIFFYAQANKATAELRAEEVIYAKPKVLLAADPLRSCIQVIENVTDYPAALLTEKMNEFERRIGLPLTTDPFVGTQVNEIRDASLKQTFIQIVNTPLKVRYKLDKQSGELVGYSNFASISGAYDEEGTTAEAEAAAVAQANAYKEKLQIPQDYVVGLVFPVQDIYNVHFYKKESSGLLSEFDQYTFAIAMKSGQLVAFARKYLPLETPRIAVTALTEAQALESARTKLPFLFEGRDMPTELTQSICHPNYLYDSREISYQSAHFCRAAWVIKLTNREEERINYIFVDLYSGEILGGDIAYSPEEAGGNPP